MNYTRIYQIKEKLNKLSALDRDYKIFGASSHQYTLLPTVTQNDIDLFESLHQVSLPNEYKAFLINISGGGAGPYYGLYSMAQGVEKARAYSTDDEDEVEYPLSLDFPISNSEALRYIDHYNACIANGDDDEIIYPEVPDELTGVIFLSEYGCGWSYALVVKGEQAGTVWFHGGGSIRPIFLKDIQWGFFDWYERWLDDSLREIMGDCAKIELTTGKTIINYDGHKLKEIPESVFLNPKLKKLVFSRNDLAEFPKRITQFNELRTLNLSMTPIVEIPLEIALLTKLKKLQLNNNYHIDLPGSLEQLENLTDLEMFHNYKLEKIPEAVCKLRGIKRLVFSHCQSLSHIPNEIGNLISLESLDLTGSSVVSKLPETIGKLKNLKYLFLNGTSISRLPESIAQLHQLEILEIGIDMLDYDETVEKIKNLENLHSIALSNRLEYPQSFQKLKKVKKVSVIHNWALYHKGEKKLSLPENITSISGMEVLNLNGNNQINALPNSIGNLSKLVQLDISSTAIRNFPDSIKDLKNLKQISGDLYKENGESGIPQKEKENLIQWFPDAKISLW